jgi:hypothetical protein
VADNWEQKAQVGCSAVIFNVDAVLTAACVGMTASRYVHGVLLRLLNVTHQASVRLVI